ncbi:MAG: TonB-dependent receptor, partial [Candidatus Neomarinimicrobiota bacterium]
MLITGRVRSHSLAPLPGAQVAALGLETGAVCDIDGYFRFQVPPLDSLRLEISYMGYESQQILVQPSLLQDSLLVITLKPTTLLFSPVVILGESSFEKLKLAEPSLRIIRQSDITSVPSIAGPDIFRALQALPGVHSTSELSNQLYIRGGTPDQNLVLYNGVPLYQPFHLFGLTSSVDALGVDYVKYYSGGFSAQYGDRLSGVLEIVTKPGSDTLETRLDWNPFNVGGTLSGALSPKWRWRLTGRRTWMDIITRLANFDLVYGYYDLEGKLSWLPNPRHLVTFNWFRSLDNYDRSNNTIVYNRDYEYHPDPAIAQADSNTIRRIDQNLIDWGNQLASLRWVARHSERITSELTVYISQLRQRVDNVNAYFAHDSASQSTIDWVEEMNNEHRYIATSRSVLATSGLTDVGLNLNGRADLPAWGEIASG